MRRSMPSAGGAGGAALPCAGCWRDVRPYYRLGVFPRRLICAMNQYVEVDALALVCCRKRYIAEKGLQLKTVEEVGARIRSMVT